MIQFTWGAQTDRFHTINFILGAQTDSFVTIKITLSAQTDSFHKGAQMGRSLSRAATHRPGNLSLLLCLITYQSLVSYHYSCLQFRAETS